MSKVGVKTRENHWKWYYHTFWNCISCFWYIILNFYYDILYYDSYLYYYASITMLRVINITIMLLWWTILSQSTHLVISWKIPSFMNLVSIFNRIDRIKIQLMICLREAYSCMISYLVVGGRPKVLIPSVAIYFTSISNDTIYGKTLSHWFFKV